MTDEQLKEMMRPHMQKAFNAGREFERRRRRTKPAPGSEVAVFSADAVPQRGGFAGVDPKLVTKYVLPDERGEYPGETHHEFGTDVQTFSDRAEMRLCCRHNEKGREVWTWVPREKAPAGL